jgi:hypothetical protein
MKALNHSFDGELQPKIEGGTVVAVTFNSKSVTNLAPLRALSHLSSLRCGGAFQQRSPLSDLGPLRGLKLTELDCSYTHVNDLRPLQGMPLERLWLRDVPVSNLAPLSGTKLRLLYCSATQVSDLSPLAGLPLEELECGNTRVRDLSPLQKTPLRILACHWIETADMRPLIGLPLEDLRCNLPPEQFADLVQGLKNLKSLNGQPVADLRYALDETRPILQWKVLGPLPLEASPPFDIPGGGLLPEAVFAKSYAGRDGKPVSWRILKADSLGMIDFRPPVDNATAYAAATIDAAADGEANVVLGGDDRIALWVNGSKVYERKDSRAWTLASDRTNARLKKGANNVLIRCDNLRGSWTFSVRFATEKLIK